MTFSTQNDWRKHKSLAFVDGNIMEFTGGRADVCSKAFAIDPNKKYTFSAEIRTKPGTVAGTCYIGNWSIAAGGKLLLPEHILAVAKSDSTLLEAAVAGGDLFVEESPMKVIVKTTKVEYLWNKRCGSLASIRCKGKELLTKPLQFNFFRAPIDNDSMRGDWYRAHLNDYTVKCYGVEVIKEEKDVCITVHQSFGWNMYQPFFYGTMVYKVSPDGALTIQCSMEATNKLTFLPRFGIRLFVPKEFDRVDYFGYGPTESYADKHQATYLGNFSAKIAELHEDYIKPQENSSHWACRHMELYSDELGVRFTAGTSFSFNASEYTQEELSAKRHNYELEKCKDNVVCIDYKMAGVGSNSCGPELDEQYRIELPKVEAQFKLTMIS